MPYPQEIIDLGEKVKNWGRWGDDDEIGTINFITNEVVKEATKCVKSGKRFSLAFPLQQQGGLQLGSMPGRVNPLRTMIQLNTPVIGDPTLFCTSDDVVTMGLQAATHWDGLCHASWNGKIYGGRDASTITYDGASVCGIEKITSLTSRGVLLDIASLYGVEELPGGHAISYEDCINAEKKQGVEVRSGDILLLRTGMMAKAKQGDVVAYGSGTQIENSPMPGFPGVGLGAVEFFFDREIAAVATDTITFEVMPWDPKVVGAILPIHCINLVMMGLTQGQNWDLEELSTDCQNDGKWDFLLEASPQPFVGGIGSPVNPIAIK
ncbi:MAG: cyclase [Acidimicrobiaceae bacterium]|nr:MAG: cyclase [Acidimicrobiaceae bacterium]